MRGSWKVTPTRCRQLALAATATVVTVYLLELVTTLLPDPVMWRAAQQGEPVDARTRMEIVRDLRAAGEEAYPRISPSFFVPSDGLEIGGRRLFPLASISSHVTVLCNETGRPVVFVADEHGFLNPPGAHSRSGVDAVLIGDSFVHGYCVTPSANLAAGLAARGLEAVNLGGAGNGPLLELATLMEYGLRLRPSFVVWVYFEGNDLRDLDRERGSTILARYLESEATQGLPHLQAEIDAALRRLFVERTDDDLYRYEVTHFLTLGSLQRRLGWTPLQRTGWDECAPCDLLARVLRVARDRCRRAGSELVFVYLAERDRFTGDRNRPGYRSRGRVLDLVAQLGLPLVDLTVAMERSAEPMTWFQYGVGYHLSDSGYRRAARIIATALGTLRGR